jgi:hypothetical protein
MPRRAAAALFASCGEESTSVGELTRAHLNHEILPSAAAVNSLPDAEQARAAAIRRVRRLSGLAGCGR